MHKLFFSLFVLLLSLCCAASDSWKEILNNKRGEIAIYYYPDSEETENSRDIVDSFEEDLVNSFINYLEHHYSVKIDVDWMNVGDFQKILEKIENGSHGDFGLSTISVTSERAQRFNFSEPYLADIQVLVTNERFVLANTQEQLAEFLDGKNAKSIPNTTLEQGLFDLKSELNIDYSIDYVSNTGELIDEIAADPTSFGYVDLINFLVSFKNLAQLKRQLFFPIKLKGIGMIYPKGSDWDNLVQEYFNSQQFQLDEERIAQKYFGPEIGRVINQITKSTEFGLYEEIVISNREKEIQYQELLKTIERERIQHRFKDTLLIVLGIVALAVAVLIIRYRVKTRTNKVLVEQQALIEKNNIQLKKLNEEKNELINILAHDLRSPLTKIQGCALMMAEERKLTNESRKLTEIIVDASNQIKNMISKILDVEAIESGNRNIQLEVIAPSMVIEEIIDQNILNAQKKNIEVSFEKDRNINVIADRFYLAQVIQNLFLNALKFSEHNAKVTLSVSKLESKVRILVKDQGPGFTEEDKKKAFKRFAQLSAKPTDGEETTGLGLSIVKKYTEMMGGKVSFESEVGKGTEFYIDLLDGQSASIASNTSITAP